MDIQSQMSNSAGNTEQATPEDKALSPDVADSETSSEPTPNDELQAETPSGGDVATTVEDKAQEVPSENSEEASSSEDDSAVDNGENSSEASADENENSEDKSPENEGEDKATQDSVEPTSETNPEKVASGLPQPAGPVEEDSPEEENNEEKTQAPVSQEPPKEEEEDKPDLVVEPQFVDGHERTNDGVDVDHLPVQVTFDIGDVELQLQDLESMKKGYTFTLDRPDDDQVNIRINGRLIGRGRLVKIDDRLGVQIDSLSQR